MRELIIMLSFIAAISIAIGCASTGPGEESDMPWNTPQSWEGSPAIPGLSQ